MLTGTAAWPRRNPVAFADDLRGVIEEHRTWLNAILTTF